MTHEPTPPVAEQLLAATLAGVLAGLADVVVVVARADAPGGVVARAAVELVALYAPPALAVGLAVGLGLALVRRTRWLDAWRLRLARPGTLFRHDASGFAHGIAFLVAALVTLVALDRAALYFATRYHDPTLWSWALAGAAIGLLLLSVLIVAFVAWALRPIARVLGRVASTGTVVLLAALGGGVAVAVVYDRAPRLFEVMDPIAVAWTPILVAVYLFSAIVVRRLVANRRALSVRIAAAIAVLFVAAAFAMCAGSYSRSQRARSLVEETSIAGQRLVRAYLQATDRDADGYSFAFGGGDCDDRDPRVHPGAPDRRGDGIDADCFAGDGSPDVEHRGDGAPGWPATSPAQSIVLVSVDALRPDHLGCYGYRRGTSPHIDRFARDAVRFSNVVAQSSRSIRSIPAVMTGFDPSQIAYGPEYLWPSVEPENVTVAEALHMRGYATAATMGTNYFDRITGFFQGFDDTYQFPVYKPARNEPVDHGLAQLERLGQADQHEHPFFVWIHLFNVHEPYMADGTESPFGMDVEGRYDGEIALADAQFQRVLDAIDRLGLRDRTTVVLASDHGEAFGEHGNHGHSYTLYDEELRSTLLVRTPGMAPRVVPQRVALFDLGPTLLDLAHVPVPRPMPARSLVPAMLGHAHVDPSRPIFSELMPDGLFPFDVKALHQDDWKLLWWVRENRAALYDLRRDPHERNDLADAQPDTTHRLVATVRAWVAETNRPANRDDEIIARARMSAPPATMTERLDLGWDGFTLLGYDLPRRAYRPSERIPLTLYLRCDDETTRNLRFEVYFEPPPGFQLPAHFHAGHFPLNGHYLTTQWRRGELLRDEVEMVVPHDIQHPVHLPMRLAVRAANEGDMTVPNARGEMVLDLGAIDIL